MNPLFACSRCFKRYPFEEIFTSSNDDMFCGDCRNATAKSKCTYCRTEFQQEGGKPQQTCPSCSKNLKLFGKPTACTLCTLTAAFKGDKCKRCLSSEYKYGSAVKCDICQQNCAFNRDDYRVDGRLHCWLCRLSYKKALAKAKKLSENDKNRNKKRSADEALKSNSSHKMSGSGSSNNRHGMSKSLLDVPEKIAKTGNTGLIPNNNSDHVVAITQLKEQIETLQKKLTQKDSVILCKDKEITEWKGKHFTLENEVRNKLRDQEKIFDTKLEVLNKKVQTQMKEIATLSKSQKRVKESKVEKEITTTNSSDNDSPNT